MFADEVCLSWTVTIIFHLTLTQALRILPNSTANSSLTTIVNTALSMTSPVGRRADQSPNLMHDTLARIDRGMLIRGTIVVAGITGLILLYVGVKTFL